MTVFNNSFVSKHQCDPNKQPRKARCCNCDCETDKVYDEVERLRRMNAELVAALRPLANLSKAYQKNEEIVRHDKNPILSLTEENVKQAALAIEHAEVR